MPRSFDMAAEYDGTFEQILEAVGDERYWIERLAQSGADETALNSSSSDADGGVDVITTQTLRANRLPGVVTRFHRGDSSFGALRGVDPGDGRLRQRRTALHHGLDQGNS